MRWGECHAAALSCLLVGLFSLVNSPAPIRELQPMHWRENQSAVVLWQLAWSGEKRLGKHLCSVRTCVSLPPLPPPPPPGGHGVCYLDSQVWSQPGCTHLRHTGRLHGLHLLCHTGGGATGCAVMCCAAALMCCDPLCALDTHALLWHTQLLNGTGQCVCRACLTPWCLPAVARTVLDCSIRVSHSLVVLAVAVAHGVPQGHEPL